MMAAVIASLVVLAGIIVSVLILFPVSSLYQSRIPELKEMHAKNGRIPVTAVKISGTERENALKAIIHCSHIPPSIGERFRTTGYADCRIRNRLFGGNLVCASGCLGLGTCARACPCDAIVLSDGLVYVNDACNGCGICVEICPKKLIRMVPVTLRDHYDCAACGTADAKTDCPTARNDCKIDLRIFPESGFKLLSRWGILKAKSR